MQYHNILRYSQADHFGHPVRFEVGGHRIIHIRLQLFNVITLREDGVLQ